MGRSIETGNSLIVSTTFRSTLFHQLLVVRGSRWLAWWPSTSCGPCSTAGSTHTGSMRSPVPRPAGRSPRPAGSSASGSGSSGILDGLLQLQSSMPLGLPPASSSRARHPRRLGAPPWSTAAPPSGPTTPSRRLRPWSGFGSALDLAAGGIPWTVVAAGRSGASVGWGLLVRVFGEAFGGIFALGLTWLFGAPGAVLFYRCVGVSSSRCPNDPSRHRGSAASSSVPAVGCS